MKIEESRIAVIGLGYVGLPLAVEFGKHYPTVGFDINERRIAELVESYDRTHEVDSRSLREAEHLSFSSSISRLTDCNVYIITVPTPIDGNRRPNLGPLIKASETVGSVIKRGDVVIYESTVYPGATEEDCIPIIEKISGLRYNVDFYAGYSPERVSPGDKNRPFTKIVKITSGSTPLISEFVDNLYKEIIPAGTFKASSIRVAEAAKIVENIQRDVNIALINELSIIFSHMDIDTADVIEAASTKWNFMRLTPGMVGGHCIGVDPYYMMYKSEAVGHIPDIIRTSREINSEMPRVVATRLVRKMIGRGLHLKGARVLIFGVTFKENCPDTRNTKVAELVTALSLWGIASDVYDPFANADDLEDETGLKLVVPKEELSYDAVILAVPHKQFLDMGISKLKVYLKQNGVFFDLKAAFPKEDSDLRL